MAAVDEESHDRRSTEAKGLPLFVGRVAKSFKSQNWMTIAIELGIVFVGVFFANLVSNWNQERLEERETQQLLLELRPALEYFTDFAESAKPYYAATRAYSDQAFAGWEDDPTVSDKQFVIAAYQASQIYTPAINGENWTSIFGVDQLRDIDYAAVRRGLSNIMTFNYGPFEAALMTPYRQHVRSIVPVKIQDAIRQKCNDQPMPDKPQSLFLPKSCDLDLPEAQFAEAAAALRSNRQLVPELRWHTAAVAAFLANVDTVDGLSQNLQEAIDKGVE